MNKQVEISAEAMKNPDAVGLRLRHLRTAIFKEARQAFANRLGIPSTTLKNYELGYRELTWSGGLSAITKNDSLGRWLTWLLTGAVELPNQRDPITNRTSLDCVTAAIEYIGAPSSLGKENNRAAIIEQLKGAMA